MNKHFSIGINKLVGIHSGNRVIYYAAEVDSYVIVSEDDVARLGAMLDAGEPDAYSVWCSETSYEVPS